jgi:hypothetical protein
MNWFSDEHKNIYSKAFSALCEDVKHASGSVWENTKTAVSVGYEKIKEGADYIDRKYHDVSEETDDKYNSDEDTSEYNECTEETDEYIKEIGKVYPDVLVKLHRRNSSVVKIWILDNDGNRKLVRGKIASYEYINNIIHTWFTYENRDKTKCKWYPTNQLYTEYRSSSNKLNPIDNVLFRYTQDGYKPYHYHPLF